MFAHKARSVLNMECPKCKGLLSLDRNLKGKDHLNHAILEILLVCVIVFVCIRVGLDRWLTTAIGVTIFVILKLRQRFYKCRSCGYKSKYKLGKHFDR